MIKLSDQLNFVCTKIQTLKRCFSFVPSSSACPSSFIAYLILLLSYLSTRSCHILTLKTCTFITINIIPNRLVCFVSSSFLCLVFHQAIFKYSFYHLEIIALSDHFCHYIPVTETTSYNKFTIKAAATGLLTHPPMK